MAKERFKIPATLDVSYFDMEFHLKSKNGLGISKPVSAKTLLFGLLAAFGWFYLVFQTFIGRSGIPLIILFTLSWVVLSVLLVKTDKTGRLGLEVVVSALNYLPKTGRRVPVRMADNVYPLQQLFNVKDGGVDVDDALIQFLDGSIGRVYHVVGSASSLMFEDDKRRIINKVDGFYRKLPVGVEVIYDTVYEGHAVKDQLASVKADAKALQSDSPGLKALLAENHDILQYAVKQSAQLTSLHQYMVVRAPSEGLLKDFENLVIGDVENEGLMFRLVRRLQHDETVAYLKSLISEA